MGSASSKAARGGAARKFPTRTPASAVSQAASRPPAPAAAKAASEAKHQDVISDSMDPDFSPSGFSSRLQKMGVVDPNPTYSPSSTAGPQLGGTPSSAAGPVFPSAKNNTTLSVLEARSRLQQQAEEDLEAFNRAGNKAQRRFLDMRTLIDAIQLQDRGMSAAEVERKLGLAPNLLSKFGRPGVLTHISG